MSRLAVIFPLSFEPRSLGTYHALECAIEQCSGWIQNNILKQLGEQEVDLFVVANYEDKQSAQGIRNRIELLYNIKHYFLYHINCIRIPTYLLHSFTTVGHST